MEYGVPAELGPACFRALRELIGERFGELTWPLEYRTLAADDQLIGVASGRPTVTISVHQDVALDDRPLFEACEQVFRAHDGRPHWGKVHYRSGPGAGLDPPGLPALVGAAGPLRPAGPLPDRRPRGPPALTGVRPGGSGRAAAERGPSGLSRAAHSRSAIVT